MLRTKVLMEGRAEEWKKHAGMRYYEIDPNSRSWVIIMHRGIGKNNIKHNIIKGSLNILSHQI